MKRLITFIILSVAQLCDVNAQDQPSIHSDQHLTSNNGGSLCDERLNLITLGSGCMGRVQSILCANITQYSRQ